MALVRPGPLVSSIRGSIGGVTFTRNRAGAIARANRKPKAPWSTAHPPGEYGGPPPGQSYSRAAYTIIRDRWQSITQAQRDDWNTVATGHYFHNALGDDSPLAGLPLFSFINVTRASVSYPPLDHPPTHPVTTIPTPGVGWNPITYDFTLFFKQPPDNPDMRVAIHFSPALSMGVTYFTDPWIWFLACDVPWSPHAVAIPKYPYTPLPECRRFFVKLRFAESSGGVSFPLIIPLTSN